MDALTTAGDLAIRAGEYFVSGYLPGKILDATLERVLKKRITAARDILFEELAGGVKLPIQAAQEDDFVAILYRFQRSALEGTARLNMRLLASVIAGQWEQGVLSADRFLYYADLLASLRREEVIALGTLYKQTLVLRDSEEFQAAEHKERFILKAFEKAKDVIEPPLQVHFTSIMTALTRTGLVTSYLDAPYITKDVICTPLMDEIWREAKFDRVLSREGITL